MNWLLLRGLIREVRHWHEFRQKFEKAMPGSTTHCLDLPGIGTETHKICPMSVEGIMEDIRSRWLVRKGQTQGPWGILGISLGGMITMSWTAKYHDDFQKMVVINSSAGNLSGPLERFKPSNIFLVPVVLFTNDAAKREKALLTLTTSLPSDPIKLDEVAKKQGGFGLKTGKLRDTGIRQLIAGMRFKVPKELAQRHPPALTLIGLKDSLVNPVCSEKIAQFLNAEVRRNPDSNHDMATDAPDWIIENVKEWIETSPKTSKLQAQAQ